MAYQVGMIEGRHAAPVASFDRFSVVCCGWLAQAVAPRTLTLSGNLEGDGDGCAQRSLVALISPFERVFGLPAIAKTHPTTRWLAPLVVPPSD